MDETRIHWGKWIKARAKHLGLKLQEVANHAGTSPRNLSKWLSSADMPAIHLRFRGPLAEILKVDLSLLPYAFSYMSYRTDDAKLKAPFPDEQSMNEFLEDEQRMKDFVRWYLRDISKVQLQKLVAYCYRLMAQALGKVAVEVNRERSQVDKGKQPK